MKLYKNSFYHQETTVISIFYYFHLVFSIPMHMGLTYIVPYTFHILICLCVKECPSKFV